MGCSWVSYRCSVPSSRYRLEALGGALLAHDDACGAIPAMPAPRRARTTITRLVRYSTPPVSRMRFHHSFPFPRADIFFCDPLPHCLVDLQVSGVDVAARLGIIGPLEDQTAINPKLKFARAPAERNRLASTDTSPPGKPLAESIFAKASRMFIDPASAIWRPCIGSGPTTNHRYGDGGPQGRPRHVRRSARDPSLRPPSKAEERPEGRRQAPGVPGAASAWRRKRSGTAGTSRATVCGDHAPQWACDGWLTG